jgi:hypothetical protein
MADKHERVPRTAMSLPEREARSRLNQLIHSRPMIRGTLNPREITCGKARCKCMLRGEKHTYLYLVASEGGKLRQRLVPRAREQEVSQWVEEYQRAQEFLEEISRLYWEKLEK